ncbi:MAG: hypothetical protein ABFD12_07325 [Syntrophorhabdus sp.]
MMQRKDMILFISHLVALSIYGFIIFLTVSPLRYVPGSPAYLAHGITLTLSIYISLFVFILTTHLAVNTLRHTGTSGIFHHSSILTLACLAVLIIGKLFSIIRW